jgi:transcriptional regulator with XRE-family HTH domain
VIILKKVHSSIRIKEIMNELDLRQVDVLRLAKPICDKYGEKLGKNDLSQYVTGKTEPGQRKLFVLGKALGVNPSWLMGLDVPKYDSEPQKKNDAITDIILRLRSDEAFLDIVKTISSLEPDQLTAVSSLLTAFKK